MRQHYGNILYDEQPFGNGQILGMTAYRVTYYIDKKFTEDILKTTTTKPLWLDNNVPVIASLMKTEGRGFNSSSCRN
jgi:hypothetical protein